MSAPSDLLTYARKAHADVARAADQTAAALGPDVRTLVTPIVRAVNRSRDFATLRRALVTLASQPTPKGIAPALYRLVDRGYRFGEDSAARELGDDG